LEDLKDLFTCEDLLNLPRLLTIRRKIMAKAAKQTQNRVATAKQFRAIVYKFAKIVQQDKKIADKYWFRLWKQVEAVLAANNPKGVMANQISDWFESDELPGYLLANLQLDFDGKGSKIHKPTRKAKIQSESKPKASKPKAKPKASPVQSNDLDDLKVRMTIVEGDIAEMSESIQTIKSGMESILAHLQG
jgi:hypothetical protein